MITLNSEKELIEVESWETIESRPGFVKSLDPTQHKLDSIIGRYLFRDRIPCGLSNCRTPHGRGYIVATKDGHETNIGKDCGKTYFGVDFENLSRKFDRDIAIRENRQRLLSFSFRIDDVAAKITNARASGADQVYLGTRPLVTPNKGCPIEVIRKIGEMVKTRTNVLSHVREATSREVEDLEARESRQVKRPHYIETTIAEIAGLQALYPENNLRDILVLDLETHLASFREKDIDALSPEELKRWVKWADTIDASIEKAQQIVGYGRQLLSKKNLRPFLNIVTEPSDVTHFQNFLAGLQDPRDG